MDIQDLKLAGAQLVSPRIFQDHRGFFIESYQKDRYQRLGIDTAFVQDNHSYSTRGVVRGMHFQSHPGQAKLIQVVYGTIFDVIVDIRHQSLTFGKWEGVYLDDQKYQQLYIPIGFAHGFCVVSPHAHVLYKTSAPYYPETECGFRFDDPTIGINWPIHPCPSLVSEKDQNSPFFDELIWR